MEQFFFSNSVSLERGSTLQPEMAAASEPEQCTICLEDLDACEDLDGERVRLDACVHEFHAACILGWSRSEPSCPVCRRAFASVTRLADGAALALPARAAEAPRDMAELSPAQRALRKIRGAMLAQQQKAPPGA